MCNVLESADRITFPTPATARRKKADGPRSRRVSDPLIGLGTIECATHHVLRGDVVAVVLGGRCGRD